MIKELKTFFVWLADDKEELFLRAMVFGLVLAITIFMILIVILTKGILIPVVLLLVGLFRLCQYVGKYILLDEKSKNEAKNVDRS